MQYKEYIHLYHKFFKVNIYNFSICARIHLYLKKIKIEQEILPKYFQIYWLKKHFIEIDNNHFNH